MVTLIHNNSRQIFKILRRDRQIEIENTSCTGALWELAKKFPNEIIAWCEKDSFSKIKFDSWDKVFAHNLVMASYAINTIFLPDSLGYIDQSPFININSNTLYGTWKMSSDVGGIKGETLLKFKSILGKEKSFNVLLNSIGKIGQQNGLFCYSAPQLINSPYNKNSYIATPMELFEFVYQHYSTIWIFILYWCRLRYEKKFNIIPLIRCLFRPKYFNKEIQLPEISSNKKISTQTSVSLDVIIPTFGRANYLFQFLDDLKNQTLVPRKVIIIEQNPNPNSTSELLFIKENSYPFQIFHKFIHKTGACNARNLALKEVTGDWVFFADDDIRIKENLLKNAFEEIQKYSLSALNMNCKQPGEKTVFHNVKQWGSFASGTSIVKSSEVLKCSFSMIYEYGHGEDVDFGMQLRNKGCDIIYHPGLEIVHLKAPFGGFRLSPELPWEKEEVLPKPFPTVMAFAIKYYTQQQIRGYNTSLFLKFYTNQPIKNPVNYIRLMKKRWKVSEDWAKILIDNNQDKAVV